MWITEYKNDKVAVFSFENRFVFNYSVKTGVLKVFDKRKEKNGGIGGILTDGNNLDKLPKDLKDKALSYVESEEFKEAVKNKKPRYK